MSIAGSFSGEYVANMLRQQWKYRQAYRREGHIVLETDVPFSQRIVIPAVDRLRRGTLEAIMRSVADHKGVNANDLMKRL